MKGKMAIYLMQRRGYWITLLARLKRTNIRGMVKTFAGTMSAYKYCKNKIRQSSVLFKVSCFLIWVAVLLNLVSFCSRFWIVDVDSYWNYGLWTSCSSDHKNVSKGRRDIECQPIRQKGIWAPNMSFDTSDMLPPMWFQSVQTAEVFGFICLIISVTTLSTLLCCVSNLRLQKVTMFVCGFAAVFIDIGVIIILWIFRLNVYHFGYSFWLAIIASLLCYVVAILLKTDITKQETIRGKSNKRSLMLEVCPCLSSPNDVPMPPDSPTYPELQEPFYSVWRQKPHKHTQGHRPRVYSDVLRNYSYNKASMDVYKPVSEGQLLTGACKKVPTIREPQSPQRRMSCPEKRHYAISDVSIV